MSYVAAECAVVLEALSSRHYRVDNEAELQLQVAEALTAAGVEFKREYRLTNRDRLDFLIGSGVVLELKVKTSEKSLLRQALRYAQHPGVHAVIVAGTCHAVLGLPAMAHGKPIYSLHLKSW